MTKRVVNVNFLYPLSIFLIYIIAFKDLFPKLYLQWSSGDDSYCLAIVPLFLYLCWEKREAFQFHRFSFSMLGVAPLMLSMALILLGELGSVITLVFLGVLGSLISMLLTFYGKRIVNLLFPVFILLFMVPLPPFINRTLTFELRVAASKLSAVMLRFSGVSVLREGNILDLGVERLQVVDACSGLRYLMPLILLAILIGYFANRTVWHRWVLVLFVIPLAILVNSFRIYFTGILTVNGYQKYAENFYHDFSGWLVFMIATALLVACSWVLKKMSKSPPPHQPDPEAVPTPALDRGKRPLLPTLTFAGLFLLTGYLVSHFSNTLITPARNSFEGFPMEIGAWSGERSTLPDEILKELWADDYLQATFRRKEDGAAILLFIPYYKYQETRHAAHAPQSCLLGGGWALISSEQRAVPVDSGPPVNIREMLMQKGDSRLLSAYFFLQRGRVVTDPWLNKLYLMADAMARKRTDGALVRIEMVVPSDLSLDAAQGAIEDFLKDLWEILEDYVPD